MQRLIHKFLAVLNIKRAVMPRLLIIGGYQSGSADSPDTQYNQARITDQLRRNCIKHHNRRRPRPLACHILCHNAAHRYQQSIA